MNAKETVVYLPKPVQKGGTSLNESLSKRSSQRRFVKRSLHINHVSQLLWSAQGLRKSDWTSRTVPSAGALYPIDIFLVVGNVKGLDAGVYHYLPAKHSLSFVVQGDIRDDLAKASLRQMFIVDAPVLIVITAVYSRTTDKYGKRGIRYVDMEAGHAGQNIYLQAAAMQMGTVMIGAFDDEKVQSLLKLPKTYTPLAIMPVGYAK